ncbi:hypothetical protein [Legionella quateirensis]|uniref:Bile acid beta-glucosidase n=1 Tax=Legionella quateirensis TaxID=45072 RepID=A0A378KUJ7_9GAMM|nr:hypothetical protein [Legionella quateirensis]KTD43351.1 bile acid beta-glucosidase [Legionella quateirensis]STY18233.1 bile acid beta-glucosidase [Legionella quateirensis]
MKFQDSKFEMRYNELWNQYAVNTDNLIKSTSGGKGTGIFVLDEARYVVLISQYAFAATNIVNNLIRQATSPGFFEDMDYVNAYLISTIENTFADFDEYRGLLGRRYGQVSRGVTLINESLESLSSLLSQYQASSYPSSQLEDDYPASYSH